MAGEKKKNTKKTNTKAKKQKKGLHISVGKVQNKNSVAFKQQRSLTLFVAAVLLASVIFIPGEMLWQMAHKGVRGFFSFLALFWALFLIFLAVAPEIEKKVQKLWFKTGFSCGLAVAFNACIYIFSFNGNYNIKQTFDDGISYHGGGVLGFLLGAPFIKLFGSLPAKILIILIILVLIVIGYNVPVKKWYTMLVQRIAEGIDNFIKELKNKQASQNPVKVADDAYFDEDDDFEAFKIISDNADEEFGKGSVDLDSDYFEDENKNLNNLNKKKKQEDVLPQSPVFSEESEETTDPFADGDYGFESDDFEKTQEKEEDVQASEEDFDLSDDNYSIDIDIDGEMEPLRSKRANRTSGENKLNSSSSDRNISMVKTEENISDEISDDDIFAELYEDDFLDVKQSPEVKQVARDISKKKEESRKPVPKGRKSELPPVAFEEPERKTVRDKNSYNYPPTELLSEGSKTGGTNKAELEETAKKLIETLASFSVKAKIVGYSRGPSVTRYEIQPAPGVKISKITGLSDDIALNLAADGVRMEAPIPGKPAIGIEIPNRHITPVSIRELLESNEFRKNRKTKKLECVLGRDVSGKIIISDLSKMPHLLIAGTTGSGKSVCVNSILMSILYRATPDEVKMILIDPKLVEFSKYKGIPHLLVPVVSDAKKAAGALNWAVNEMEERYKEFSIYNVKDIDSYNRMVERNLASMTPEEIEEIEEGQVIDGEFIPPRAKKKMPKIVIAIDELADLMMVAPGDVEEAICRLAQKARAAGMHLVIATQRPSVNVITGVIKANIPSRISLKVASYVDSKTILDMGGGEKLIGRGDMLYYPVAAPKPIRVQGGFSSDDDIEAVTDFIKGNSKSDYDANITEQIEQISETLGTKSSKDSSENDDIDDSDPMLEEAIKVVIEAGQASTSLLQRRLRLGYARAGRLIDTMEQMGIVGPHEGSKSRKVLMTHQQWLERQVTGSVE